MKNKVQFLGFILLILIVSNVTYSKSHFKMPKGKHVLLDGNCLDEEWKDSKQIEIGKNYKFKFKKTKNFAYFCIKPPKAQLFSAELYLSPKEKKAYTFHVSAKLGERELVGDNWNNFTQESNWWETNGWTANALRPKDFKKPKFLPSKAIEFQISRSHFKSKTWRIMLTLSGGSIIFPKDSNNLKFNTWAEFRL